MWFGQWYRDAEGDLRGAGVRDEPWGLTATLLVKRGEVLLGLGSFITKSHWVKLQTQLEDRGWMQREPRPEWPGVEQWPGKEVVEDGFWEQGLVVSQAPEDFAEDLVFFYIACKDSFEMGRENAYKVRDKLGVKRMVERGLWQYCTVDEIFFGGGGNCWNRYYR